MGDAICLKECILLRFGACWRTKVSRHDGLYYSDARDTTDGILLRRVGILARKRRRRTSRRYLKPSLWANDNRAESLAQSSGCVPSPFSMGELWNYRCGNTSRYEEFLVSTEEGGDRDRWWFCFGYEISGILWGRKSDGSVSVNYYYVGGGRRRREIIRRDYLDVGLFIILRGRGRNKECKLFRW